MGPAIVQRVYMEPDFIFLDDNWDCMDYTFCDNILTSKRFNPMQSSNQSTIALVIGVF